MKNNMKNEQVKRRYFGWLRQAKGFSEATVRCIEAAICLYEEFSHHGDFGDFGKGSAINFKRWLEGRRFKGDPVSLTTNYHHLRHLKGFFDWLATQSGYKSKVRLEDVTYLSLEKSKVREISYRRTTDYPSLEYVVNLANSIPDDTELSRRDRALIAFLLLSGMRDLAIATLPLKCFDKESLVIYQIPADGVKTKFNKPIVSQLWRFSQQLVDWVIDWAKFLEIEKGFCPGDPLFPRSRVHQQLESFGFESQEVEPVFWATAGPIRQILKSRSDQANLPYYKPHAFRQAASHHAQKFCRTPEEFKAISQNLGHEDIATTLRTYGTLEQSRVLELIASMDFSPSVDTKVTAAEAAALENLLKKTMRNRLT